MPRAAVRRFLLACFAVGLAGTAAADEPVIDLTWGAKIPVRDGTKLNATLYRPNGKTEKLPVVVTITPYIADTYHERGSSLDRSGYCFEFRGLSRDTKTQ